MRRIVGAARQNLSRRRQSVDRIGPRMASYEIDFGARGD
jgi:hypothetical protein